MEIVNSDLTAERFANRLLRHLRQRAEAVGWVLDWGEITAQSGIWVSNQGLEAGQAISFQQYYHLLAVCTPQLVETDFFVCLGDDYDITDLGVLGYAMLSAQNLEKSWALSLHSGSLLHHPLQRQRRLMNQRVSVELSAPLHNELLARALIEEWIFGTWKWIRQRLPDIANAEGLSLSLAYPAPNYQHRYAEYFKGEIKFGQRNNELSFPEHWYYQAFPSANPATAALCQQQCQLIQAGLQAGDELLDQVRSSLLLKPQREFPNLDTMAARFRMPSHTFHRRLKTSGQSYRMVVTEVKMALAKHYVLNTQLPFQEVSYLLDFEHPPSFYRAFKKNFGYTPDQLRGGRS